MNPIISKIFEHCLLEFVNKLETSERQFGFKKGVGCVDAISALKKTVSFFTKKGNTVNIGVVDIAKAFDRVSIPSLLILLLKRGINPFIVKVLNVLLSSSSIVVHWCNKFSNPTKLTAGVRQGSVLSPFLFSIFIDSVLLKLEESGLGCFFLKRCLNSVMYADDLVLLTISVTDLQKLFDICALELHNLNLNLNYNKSYCLRIGPNFQNYCENITSNSQVIKWSSSAKVLGASFQAGKDFKWNWMESRGNFYKSTNAILGKLGSPLHI